MTLWICSGLTILSALSAAFLGDLRRSILALWICGLGVGGIYLALGAETLAVVQWIVSTLVAISFVFYAVTFGEFGLKDSRPMSKKLLTSVLPIVLGIGFVLVIGLGARGLPDVSGSVTPSPGQGLADLGRSITHEHFVALEVLAFTLLMVIVGSGTVSRPEAADEPEVSE